MQGGVVPKIETEGTRPYSQQADLRKQAARRFGQERGGFFQVAREERREQRIFFCNAWRRTSSQTFCTRLSRGVE